MTTREQLLKQLGKINVERIPAAPVPRTVTGILSMDALFRGGIPQGRVIEIYGQEGSGKSTTSLLLVRQYAAQGLRCAILDAENSIDLDYAMKYGLDLNAVDDGGQPLVDIYRANIAEEWFDALREIVKSRLYHLVVVDTLAKFAPRVEFEASIDKGTMGVMPRLVSRFFRIVGPLLYNNPVTILVLNQERMDIGNANPYTGTPRTSPGGRSMKHEATVTLQTMRLQDKRIGDRMTGHIFRFKTVKSKLWNYDIKHIYELHVLTDDETGVYEVDFANELLAGARALGLLLGKDGKPWKANVAFFEGENIGNGEKQVLEFLAKPSDVRDRIEAAIYSNIASGVDAHVEQQDEIDPDTFDLESVPDSEPSYGESELAFD